MGEIVEPAGPPPPGDGRPLADAPLFASPVPPEPDWHPAAHASSSTADELDDDAELPDYMRAWVGGSRPTGEVPAEFFFNEEEAIAGELDEAGGGATP